MRWFYFRAFRAKSFPAKIITRENITFNSESIASRRSSAKKTIREMSLISKSAKISVRENICIYSISICFMIAVFMNLLKKLKTEWLASNKIYWAVQQPYLASQMFPQGNFWEQHVLTPIGLVKSWAPLVYLVLWPIGSLLSCKPLVNLVMWPIGLFSHVTYWFVWYCA